MSETLKRVHTLRGRRWVTWGWGPADMAPGAKVGAMFDFAATQAEPAPFWVFLGMQVGR